MDAYYLSLKTEDEDGNPSIFSTDGIQDLQKIIDAITRALDAMSDPIAKNKLNMQKDILEQQKSYIRVKNSK